MKSEGSIFEYEEQRNKDLMRAYKECLCEAKYIVLGDIYEQVVNKPAERFWVSERRAAIVVSNMLNNRPVGKMRQNKREMFEEIFRRVKERMKEFPEESVYNLTIDVVGEPAPKFYLTPGSAKAIINKCERGWYEERSKKIAEHKRKYRHLYM